MGDDCVRITVIKDSTNKPVTTPIDFSYKNIAPNTQHFGKVSNLDFRSKANEIKNLNNEIDTLKKDKKIGKVEIDKIVKQKLKLVNHIFEEIYSKDENKIIDKYIDYAKKYIDEHVDDSNLAETFKIRFDYDLFSGESGNPLNFMVETISEHAEEMWKNKVTYKKRIFTKHLVSTLLFTIANNLAHTTFENPYTYNNKNKLDGENYNLKPLNRLKGHNKIRQSNTLSY